VPRPTSKRFCDFGSPPVANDRVGSVKEFSGPTLPTDLASEFAQLYDASEPTSTPSATTADAGYVAPGSTDADPFSSFLLYRVIVPQLTERIETGIVRLY